MPVPATQTGETWILRIPRSWGMRDYLRQRVRYLGLLLVLAVLGAVTVLGAGEAPGDAARWAGWGMLSGGGTLLLLAVARAFLDARNNTDLDTPLTLTLDDAGVHTASVYGTGFSSWESLASPVASPTVTMLARFCHAAPSGEALRQTFAAGLRSRCGEPALTDRAARTRYPEDMRPTGGLTPEQCLAAFVPYGRKAGVIGGICLMAAYVLTYTFATGQNPFLHSFLGLTPGWFIACGYYGWGRGLVDVAAKKSAGLCRLIDEPNSLCGFDGRHIYSRRTATAYAARMERWNSWYETDDLFVLQQGIYLSFFPKSPWSADECRRLREYLRARVGKRL